MLEDPIVKDQFLIGSDTVFDFGHRIFSPSDITCYVYNPDTKTETTLTSGTDFSVGLKPETTDYSNGARVTLLTEQPAAGKLTVVRTVLPEQGVSLPNFGKIPSESLEAQLDRTIASVQQLHDTVQLAYKIPYGQSGTITPEESIKDMISSGGGGGGGGGSSYEFSNEFDVTSGGSVSINKIDKEKIDGLESATVSSASVADNLVSSAKDAIVSSAVKSAAYTGPFAVTLTSSGANVSPGVFVLDNVRYTIAGSSGISLPSGDYLCLSGTYDTVDNSAYFGYWVGDPDDTSISSNTLLTKLAANVGGKCVQIQFGEITCVTWGAAGGGAGVTVEELSLGSNSATATGLLNVFVTEDGASPGQAFTITISGVVHSAIIVPQSGGSGITSSYTRVISSGVQWSATSEINASQVKMYFIKFN